MSSDFVLEVIPSKSGVEAQLAKHRATLPFLEGTKPPVTLSISGPEDSFVGATIDQLAAFVMQKLYPSEDDVFTPSYRSETHFFIIDENTLRDGSMILVKLNDAEFDEYSESEVEEDGYESTERLRLAGEKVEMKFGKKSLTKAYLFGQQDGADDSEADEEGKFKMNTIRIGSAIAGLWTRTIEHTSCDMDVLKMSCANDGTFWGDQFDGKDPPPMEERAGMHQLYTSTIGERVREIKL